MPDFFVYSRDAAGVEALRDDPGLQERHWAYMDPFAESMVARGPTFAADGETVTGSLHVVGLPSVDAAREFVAQEPNDRAGVYAEHLVRRFENLLGRTMWEFPATDEPKFLVICGSQPVLPERLIVYGALSGLDDEEPAGFALALEAPSAEAVAELVGGELEIHRWEFGGRR